MVFLGNGLKVSILPYKYPTTGKSFTKNQKGSSLSIAPQRTDRDCHITFSSFYDAEGYLLRTR